MGEEAIVPCIGPRRPESCLDVEDFVPGQDLILEMDRAGLESQHGRFHET